MAERQPRSFEDAPATREKTPILMGITAPSGGGKTYSALRVATGIVKVTGGEIFFVDTDNRRALQYADLFKFRHVPFEPPHSSLAYVDALRYCVRRGAGCIIVDSMSHEHEGLGGMLEYHEAEVERLSGGNDNKREQVKMLAWSKPKAARRALILEIQRLGVPAIFCFRAKEGVKPVRGANGRTEVVQQGFTPIAGDEFVFEMTLNALLMPGAKGVPTWLPEHVGEKKMTKLPAQFESLERITAPLDEKLGENLAKWSLGGAEPKARPAPPETREEELRQDSDPVDRDDPPPPSSAPDSGPDDHFPGDPSPPPADEPAGDPRDQADDQTRAATPDEAAGALEALRTDAPPAEGGTDFAAFADVVAGAEDWPAIAAALRTLTTSAGWKAADVERQRRARIIAYIRLRQLNEAGYRFDFLKDPHAFRCYVEAEEDREGLALNFLAFKTTPPWNALNQAARDAFVSAVDARIAILDAGGQTETFA